MINDIICGMLHICWQTPFFYNNALTYLPWLLINDWLIIEKSFNPEEDTSEKFIELYEFFYNILYILLVEYISNVILKMEGIPRRKAKENLPNDSDFHRKLVSVYQIWVMNHHFSKVHINTMNLLHFW